MPHERSVWIGRIKSIERDYSSTRLALDRLLAEARRDPAILAGKRKVQDVARASGRLEGTYLIRLFAEFETGLRLYWATIRETEPPTQHLLEGIAARRDIPPARLVDAHTVREYRNSLVHERDEGMAPISIAEARGYLCRFFAFLPPTW
jgi:hypothetical protein